MDTRAPILEDAFAELIHRDPLAGADAPSMQHFRLRPGLNTVGRAPDNSVVVDLDQVSRHHAELMLVAGRAYLKDLGSSNHTYVNDRPVTLAELRDGDLVRLGRVPFAFVLTAAPADQAPGADGHGLADTAAGKGARPDSGDHERFRDCDRLASTGAADGASGIAVARPAGDAETDGEAGRSGRPGAPRSLPPPAQRLLRKPSPTAPVLRRQASDAEAATRLGILLDIARRLGAAPGLQALPSLALDLLFEALAVDRAAILLPRADGTPRVVAQRVRAGLPADPGFCNPDVVAAALSRGAPVVTTDAIHDPLRTGAALDEVTTLAVAVCAPLPATDRPAGALYLDNLALRHVHTEADVEFVGLLAAQIAVALEHARRMEAQIETQVEARLEARLQTRAEAQARDPQRPLPEPRPASAPESAPTPDRRPPAESDQPRHTADRAGRRRPAAASQPVVTGRASALCCEIAGFGATCARLRPPEVFELLARYTERMVDGILLPRQATLQRAVDAMLLALWGTPQPGPADADRAVDAAVAMQRGLTELNRAWTAAGHAPIAVCIGIATGTVAVGATPLQQVLAIGAPPRRALRLCRNAADGEVLLCAKTLARLSPGRYRTEERPPVAGHGRASPPPVYRLDWRAAVGEEPADGCA